VGEFPIGVHWTSGEVKRLRQPLPEGVEVPAFLEIVDEPEAEATNEPEE
jgi:hypothetical protein